MDVSAAYRPQAIKKFTAYAVNNVVAYYYVPGHVFVVAGFLQIPSSLPDSFPAAALQEIRGKRMAWRGDLGRTHPLGTPLVSYSGSYYQGVLQVGWP